MKANEKGEKQEFVKKKLCINLQSHNILRTNVSLNFILWGDGGRKRTKIVATRIHHQKMLTSLAKFAFYFQSNILRIITCKLHLGVWLNKHTCTHARKLHPKVSTQSLCERKKQTWIFLVLIMKGENFFFIIRV